MLAQWIVSFIGQKHYHKVKNKQLAEELGYTEEYVSMVLNGHREPADAAQKFTEALGRIVAKRRSEDVATYRTWRDELVRSGKTPEELLAQYEAAGMTEYVKQIRALIQQMEGSA